VTTGLQALKAHTEVTVFQVKYQGVGGAVSAPAQVPAAASMTGMAFLIGDARKSPHEGHGSFSFTEWVQLLTLKYPRV
jgi:hypothetical protein